MTELIETDVLILGTGIAGLTLGGGFGWLTRKYGMTVDNLSSVDLVTAQRKQYAFADPVLRLWAGLFERPAPADVGTVAAAVQRFALARLSGIGLWSRLRGWCRRFGA